MPPHENAGPDFDEEPVKEKHSIEGLIETVNEIDDRVGEALRKSGLDPVAAVKEYSEFLGSLIAALRKGAQQARDAARLVERESLSKLDVSQTAISGDPSKIAQSALQPAHVANPTGK
ncbi:hypothetical protein WME91_52030 [Sorangium sp. So ce269]